MLNISELIKNNTTSSERNTLKKQAIDSGKIYIQIAPRSQRGKTYINAIATYGDKNMQLSKKLALDILLAYANANANATDTERNQITLSVEPTLLKEICAYIDTLKLQDSDVLKMQETALNTLLDTLENKNIIKTAYAKETTIAKIAKIAKK